VWQAPTAAFPVKAAARPAPLAGSLRPWRCLSVKRNGGRTVPKGLPPLSSSHAPRDPTPRFRSAVGPHPAPLGGLDDSPPAFEWTVWNSSLTNSFFHGEDLALPSWSVASWALALSVASVVWQWRANLAQQRRDEGGDR